MELLTAAQMRAIEAAAIASGQVTGLELMERAGAGVVAAILEEWPELAEGERRAVVLCGPGNNGGDGFVVARLLRERGWAVEVFLFGDAERLPADARVNYERWLGMGDVVDTENAGENWEFGLREYDDSADFPDLYIDAVFGTGLARPVSYQRKMGLDYLGVLAGAQAGAEGWPRFCRVVSIDVPSGLCADSGRVLWEGPRNFGICVPAKLTVTFQTAKVGHLLADGPRRSGKLQIVDIGLRQYVPHVTSRYVPSPRGNVEQVTSVEDVHARHASKWLGLAKGLEKISVSQRYLFSSGSADHKYTHGHALILSGPPHHGGAARLAARGALRIGAGVVTVGASGEAMAEHAARLDAIMLRQVGDGADLVQVLQDQRINALCLGPGLGFDARAKDLLALALMGPPPPSPPHEGEGGRVYPGAALGDGAIPLPLRGEGAGVGGRRMVLDADALTILAADPTLFAALHKDCILTPHVGEFARLFPDIAEKLNAPATQGPAYSKVDATREAAKRAGCTVLFKGPDTVIATPEGRCAINAAVYDRAAPWLATAGSGDVLAGFISGLLARGFDPFNAAQTAAWLHVECALSFGPGLIAEDLPEELPKVFRKLAV